VSRLIPLARALNGATTTNAQPPPLLDDGLPLPLPTTAGLPDRLPCDGAAAGEPLKPLLAAADGVAAGGLYVTGAARVGTGAGTDEECEIGTGTEEMWEECDECETETAETCEECETWERWLPEPDT
jgi:hypothetical protein